ncbi:MAG TPA: N-acetyltransferase [Ramlibacter sp.]|nr:N-acetyltransferase [Ramlibacter sp.]
MDRGLAPCETLLSHQSILAAQHYEASWEVGRLVLASGYRSGPDALKRCLFLTLVYLMRTHEIRNLYASCSPLLSRLYRRFGFSVVLKDACEQPDGTYSLIHGTVPDVLDALCGNDDERAFAMNELAAWEMRQRKAA